MPGADERNELLSLIALLRIERQIVMQEAIQLLRLKTGNPTDAYEVASRVIAMKIDAWVNDGR